MKLLPPPRSTQRVVNTASFVLSSIFIVAVLFIAACQKADFSPTAIKQKLDVAAAKEWWYGSFRKSAAYSDLDFNSPFTPAELLSKATERKTVSIKFPVWSKSSIHQVDGEHLVEVPLKYFTAQIVIPNKDLLSSSELVKIMDASRSTLVFKKSGETLTTRIFTYIPDISYLQQFGSDFHEVSYFQRSSFTGWVVIREWNEKVVRFKRIEKGEISGNYRVLSNEEKGKYLINTRSIGNATYANMPMTFGGFMASLGLYECSDYYENAGDEPTPEDCRTWVRIGNETDLPEIIVPDDLDSGEGCGGSGGGSGEVEFPDGFDENTLPDLTFVEGALDEYYLQPQTLNDFLACFTNEAGSTYSVTLAVDQPKYGSRDPYRIDPNDLDNPDVGHTYLIFEQKKADGGIIRKSIGFYPSVSVSPRNPATTGVVLFETGNHEIDASVTTTLTYANFNLLISNSISNKSTGYNLNSNNCTTWALNRLQSIGLTFPRTNGTWAWGMGRGLNPGDLGEDLRTMQLAAGQVKSVSTRPMPQNVGTCN
jgi:hypothetical protein